MTKGLSGRKDGLETPHFSPQSHNYPHGLPGGVQAGLVTGSQLGGEGLREAEWREPPSHPGTGASIPWLPQQGLRDLVSGMGTGAPTVVLGGCEAAGGGVLLRLSDRLGDRGA